MVSVVVTAVVARMGWRLVVVASSIVVSARRAVGRALSVSSDTVRGCMGGGEKGSSCCRKTGAKNPITLQTSAIPITVTETIESKK